MGVLMPTKKPRDLVTWDDENLSAWLDAEAERRDRSRSWMLAEAVRQWRKRLDRERLRAAKARKIR